MKDNFSELSRSDIEYLIDSWVTGRNAERNRRLLYRRLIDGITYDSLAEEFDLSVRQVKNITYKYVSRISKHI